MPICRLHRALFSPTLGGGLGVLAVLLAAFATPSVASAQALARCLELSRQDQAVHNCLDNMLDELDDAIAETDRYIAAQMDDGALDAFNAAEQAFFAYRRQNCLWYLEFNGRDAEAAWLAKDCLVAMSQQRLGELRSLISGDAPSTRVLRGLYVYGVERNSFQPCGSNQRYWVEGDSAAVGGLQQQYLATATGENQLMFVELDGVLSPDPAVQAGHAGSVNLQALRDLRIPQDGDCAPLAVAAGDETPEQVLDAEPVTNAIEEPPEAGEDEDAEQRLRAYFGEWLAVCEQDGAEFGCELSTALNDARADAVAELQMTVDVEQMRLAGEFPNQEIDSPNRVRWTFSDEVFGELPGAEVRVDQQGSRIELPDRVLEENELLARLLAGTAVDLEVVEHPGDEQGERYRASLLGLSRAFNFAVEFIADARSR